MQRCRQHVPGKNCRTSNPRLSCLGDDVSVVAPKPSAKVGASIDERFAKVDQEFAFVRKELGILREGMGIILKKLG